MQKFGVPVVVAVNRFASDTEAEIEAVKEIVEETGVLQQKKMDARCLLACPHAPFLTPPPPSPAGAYCVMADHFSKGGAGAADLAAVVERACLDVGRPLVV